MTDAIYKVTSLNMAIALPRVGRLPYALSPIGGFSAVSQGRHIQIHELLSEALSRRSGRVSYDQLTWQKFSFAWRTPGEQV